MEYKLKDIMKFKPGFAFKKEEMSNSGINLIKIGDLKNNRVLYSDCNKVLEKEKYNEWIICNGDILIALTGDPVFKGNIQTWVGRTSKYSHEEPSYLNQRICKIMPNERIVNKDYIYYWLINYENTYKIASLFRGSANQANISHNDIGNLKIILPGINIQSKIVKILSSLDAKIELNNKINDNLQEISKQLYKRWFVDFEFPNEIGKPYKISGGKMADSELGDIPEGWKVGFINDNKLTKIIKSGVKKYEGLKKYVATADVEGTFLKSSDLINFNNKPSRANMTPIPNSIWFAKMQGSIKNILVDQYMENILNNYIFSTGFMGIECLKNSTYYIWNFINNDNFNEIKSNLSNGTLMAGISNSTITGCKYLIPKQFVLDCFEEKVRKINKKIYSNSEQNQTLTQLRDTLLPKLMNGEIDPENIEI